MQRGLFLAVVGLTIGGGVVGLAIAGDAPPTSQPPPSAGAPSADLPRQRIDLGNGVAFEMVQIPAGEFPMGSPETEAGRDLDETLHCVRITKPYWLATTEVTQAAWDAVMESTPSSTNGATRPVTMVSWNDCQAFCKRLNEKTSDGGFRLPTEAEWEHACRAGSKTRFAFGDDPRTLAEYAWYDPSSEAPRVPVSTHGVGLLKPNAWGLHDMLGNVWEWCQDGYGGYELVASGVVVDPAGREGSPYRVSRGGGWGSAAANVRCAVRDHVKPDASDADLGFRLAKSVASDRRPSRAANDAPLAHSAADTPEAPPEPAPAAPLAPEPPPASARPGGSPANKDAVPSWARVAPEQIEAAKRAGAPVAFENSIGMRFVLVPAGTFTMGSPEGDTSRDPDEAEHRVTLTQAFYVSIYETTNGQYRRFKKDHDSGKYKEESLNGETQPVVHVSHTEAAEFATWLSGQESGRAYRSPTEAEWEYAARAKTTTRWSFADDEAGFVRNANIADAEAKAKFGLSWSRAWDDGFAATAPVGSFLPNGWGLHDMHGNVWEWCADWKADDPAGPVTDPTGPASGSDRVLRGGSWHDDPGYARAAYRLDFDPVDRYCHVGFRLVVSVSATR